MNIWWNNAYNIDININTGAESKTFAIFFSKEDDDSEMIKIWEWLNPCDERNFDFEKDNGISFSVCDIEF